MGSGVWSETVESCSGWCGEGGVAWGRCASHCALFLAATEMAERRRKGTARPSSHPVLPPPAHAPSRWRNVTSKFHAMPGMVLKYGFLVWTTGPWRHAAGWFSH